MSVRRWMCVAAACALTACVSAPAQKKGEAPEVPESWPPSREARDLTPTSSQAEHVLIAGGVVMTATGEVHDPGWVLLRDGVIVSVSGEPIEAPEGAEVLDAKGRFVTPGIIDTHSHLGVYATPSVRAHSDGNEMTSPATPQVDARHSVWPQDPGFERALAGGVTTLQILPGSGNLIGGRSFTMQLHPGVSARALMFPGAPSGLKMACGENPKRVYGERGRLPSTRMGNMAAWRAQFDKAAKARDDYDAYVKKLGEWSKPGASEDKRPKPPARDAGVETLVGVLRGEVLVHVHCYRADEMIQVLELADEYGFRVRSFHHAVEAYKIRDILAAWDVSVSTWADWWGFKIEAHDAIMQNAALVSQAGARAIIHSDSAIDIQRLNQEASKAYWAAVHAGLEVTEDEALRWITSNPAWALGIDEVTGTLEAGKRADVVVWSAHPFSVYALAEQVFVEGVREHDITRPSVPRSDFEVGHVE